MIPNAHISSLVELFLESKVTSGAIYSGVVLTYYVLVSVLFMSFKSNLEIPKSPIFRIIVSSLFSSILSIRIFAGFKSR